MRGTLLVLSRYLLKYTGYKGIYSATSSLIVTDLQKDVERDLEANVGSEFHSPTTPFVDDQGTHR